MESRDRVSTFDLNNQIPPREVLHKLCEEIQSRLDQFDEIHSADKAKDIELAANVQRKKMRVNPAVLTCTLLVCFIAWMTMENKVKR